MAWLIENAHWIAAFGAAIALVASFIGQYGDKKRAEENVAYLRGDDSYVYLAYRDLNGTNQHAKLIQVGPNPVWDISVQAYPLSQYPTRGDVSVSEQASMLFRFEDSVLHPERVSTLVKFPMPDPNDRNTWDRLVELFTRSGAYQQLLLLDHSADGEWSQGYIVFFAKKDGRSDVMKSSFDSGFPTERRQRFEKIVSEIVRNAAQVAE